MAFDVSQLFTGKVEKIAVDDLVFDERLEQGQVRGLVTSLWELRTKQLEANPPSAPCEATVVACDETGMRR